MEKVILSQIIKELVLENGHAVLPGFGVFSTENVSAFFSDEGRKINPPTKRILFAENSAAEGDELLERVSSKLNESSAGMDKTLKEEMAVLSEELKTSGSLVLEGFGTLFRRNGNVDFEPENGRDFFAELYAMEPIMLRFAEHEPDIEPGRDSEMLPESVSEVVLEPVFKLEPAERQSRWFTALVIILTVVIIAAMLLILGRNGAFDSLLYSDDELELIWDTSGK